MAANKDTSQGIPERVSEWEHAEKLSKNAVVQIRVSHAPFNWTEPYKSSTPVSGAGSGFFIDKEGHILTNFHVVDQAKSIQVFVPAMGQKPLDAHVIGVCPEVDLAYLKLDDEGIKSMKTVLKKIPYLELGDSDMLFPTEPVLALGYPLGQRYLKSTVGVIAGRDFMHGCSFMHITAPINPGNSGGPLLNLFGKVVGINSAIMSGSQNIGYIVPIYEAQVLLKDLQQQNLVRKPQSGFLYNQTTDEHAKQLGNPVPGGVYINCIEKGSMAQKAGVKEGDMLYKINGHKVDIYGDVTVNWISSLKVSLDEYLLRMPTGTSLELELYRNGKKQSLTCVLEGTTVPEIRSVYPDYEPGETEYEVIGGMCVMQLRLNHMNQFAHVAGLQEYRLHKNKYKKRLIITKVLPGSVVDRVGCIYPGALLEEINGKKVQTIKEARDALALSKDSGYVSIKLANKMSTVVPLESLLSDEVRLTSAYKFSSTPTIKMLKATYKK